MSEKARNHETEFSDVDLRLMAQLRATAPNYNALALLLTLMLGLLFHLEYQSTAVIIWVGWLLAMEVAVAASFVVPMSLPTWARWNAVFFLLGCAGWGAGPLLLGITDLFSPITSNMYAVLLLAWAAALQNPLSAQRELALAAIALLLAPWLAWEIYSFDSNQLASDITLISMLLLGGAALFLHTRRTHQTHYDAASLQEKLNEAETELHDNREMLSHMQSRHEEISYWDIQTGLPSLSGFQKRLAELPPTRSGSAVCIKLHNLDDINNAFGHDISDAIIADTARKLCCLSVSGDIRCRSGSSSFLVLFPNRKINKDMLRKVLELSTLTSVGTLLCPMTVGVAHLAPGYDISSAIKVATSSAMNTKNLLGEKVTIVEGNASDIESIELQSRLGFDLSEAIESDALSLVYQPQHNALSGKVYGFEALARWQHPVLGNISPGTFIPIAEETAQMVALGNRVMERALRDFSESGLFERGISLSINISPLQLTNDFFIPLFEKLCKKYGVPTRQVTLEITESIFMEDPDFFTARINQAKALGARISLDDFGTGYSSLSCLSQFPIDTVKADRSLIARITTDPSSDKLFGSIVYMCNNLELPVIVEGVETNEQLRAVLEHGASLIQGFHYAPGMVLEEAMAYLDGTPASGRGEGQEALPL